MKKMLLALVTFLSFSLSALAGVNINTATQAELESLKNIGPVKAQAIIDYRKKNGGFKTVDELNNVPGIGDKTMQSLKSEISVSGATTVAASANKTAKDAKPAKETKAAKIADVATPAAKPADVKPADTDKADKKAAADAKKAAKKAAADEKKAAADAKNATKAEAAPAAAAATKTK
jgi:competence protein ComEA